MTASPYEAVDALMAPAIMIAPGQPLLDGAEFPPSEHNIEMAKVWATMAVAYEQRTANLIAAFAHLHGEGGVTLLGDAYPLLDQIKERLNLE